MSRKVFRVERLERAAAPKEKTVIRVWMSWSENEVVSDTGEVLTQAQFDALYPDAIHVSYPKDNEEKENSDDDNLG